MIITTLRSAAGSAVGRRLINGSAANFADKLALLVSQLIAIPLLSTYWGADRYGTWLMLMTVPTYVALSDFGLWTVAGVEITQRVARRDLSGALEAFQSAWVIVTAVLLAIASIATVYFGLGLTGAFGKEVELPTVVLIVTGYGIAIVQTASLWVVYRSTNKFAIAGLISTLATVFEGLALIVAVTCGGGMVAAALGLLLVRLLAWMVSYALLRRLEPWVRLGGERASRTSLRRLAGPALAALSFAIANSISLQGAILAIGWVAGPGVAAVFGAARFLARIPLQFSGLVVRTSIPELTRAQVTMDTALQGRLLLINVVSALVPAVPWALLLTPVGPLLLLAMSDGQLRADWWLFGLLTLMTTLGAFWQAAASPLIASNLQSRFSYAYTALSAVAISCAFLPLSPTLVVIGTALLASEVAMTSLILRLNSATHRQVATSDGEHTSFNRRGAPE